MTLRLYRPTPCFHLLQGNGECPSWHDDGCPHHDTVEQAVEEISNFAEGAGDDEWWAALELVIEERPAPCWVVECDGRDHGKAECEDKYGGYDGNFDTWHFDESGDADLAKDADWVLAPHTDGRTYAACPEVRWQMTDDAESSEHAVLMHLGYVQHDDDYQEPSPAPGPNDVRLPYPEETPA